MAKIRYAVQNLTDPVTKEVYRVPYIVDRNTAIPLEEIVRRAVDRNLIPGLKPSAAKGVAEGIVAQMREEFLQGNGVRFGGYFNARLYLTGKTDENGKLTPAANGVQVKLMKSNGFNVSLDDFEWENVGGYGAVIEFVTSPGQLERNILARGEQITAVGAGLPAMDTAAGDNATVYWTEGIQERSATLAILDTGAGFAVLAWNEQMDVIPSGSEVYIQLRYNDGGTERVTPRHKAIIAAS